MDAMEADKKTAFALTRLVRIIRYMAMISQWIIRGLAIIPILVAQILNIITLAFIGTIGFGVFLTFMLGSLYIFIRLFTG